MNDPVRGMGVGFRQVELSHIEFKKEEANITELRQHATKMKAVTAQILRPSSLPSTPGGVAEPKPLAVQANVNAKIFNPTRGGTAVQFLENSPDVETKKTVKFCRNIQETLIKNFGETTTEEFKINPNVPAQTIIPIENLHVTALAMGVVDAKDSEEFEKRLENNFAYRQCFEYFDRHPDIGSIVLKNGESIGRDGLLAKIASQDKPFECMQQNLPDPMHNEMANFIREDQPSEKLVSFLESGGAVFNAVDLKVTDNGSIVLQLASNNDLVQAKEGLVAIGGIAKGSLGGITASTLGFIPNFDKATDGEKQELRKVIGDLNTAMLTQGFTIRMDSLTYVDFKVNTLAPHSIQETQLKSNTQLSHMKFRYLE